MIQVVLGLISGGANFLWNNKIVLYGLLIAATFLYVRHLNNSIDTLEKNNATLVTTIEQQKKTIEKQKEDAKNVIESNKKLSEEKQKANQEKEDLEKKIYRENEKKKSLEELAIKKTSLIEKLVNNATKDVFRCFETLSKGGDC